MTASSANRLAKTALTARNGLPVTKPYVYNGDGTSMPEAEVAARLAAIRIRLSAPPRAEDAPLSAPPEWHREQRDEAPASAAAPPAKPIDWRHVYTHRTAFYVRPPGLDARLAELRKPARRRAPRRCRGCGYLKTRCACEGRRS